jgi:glyoxylase-like metal-dependent hydrolase (beta-lactamase superfamily II)
MTTLKGGLRILFGVCVAALVFAVSCPPAKASAELRTAPNPGVYRMKVGDFEVTALYDGGGPGAFTPEMLHGNQKEIVSFLKKAYVDPKNIVGSDTSFLVNTGEKLILVDAGTGGHWGGPALGKLLSNLRAIGYRAEDVDPVLLTHLHVDHSGVSRRSTVNVFSRTPKSVRRRRTATFGCPRRWRERHPRKRRSFLMMRAR